MGVCVGGGSGEGDTVRGRGFLSWGKIVGGALSFFSEQICLKSLKTQISQILLREISNTTQTFMPSQLPFHLEQQLQ